MDNKLTNAEIAKILYEIADILELQGVDFKPGAYRKAAQSIETFSTAISELYQKEGLKGLKKIPGVGQHISIKLEELIRTGRLDYYSKLKKQVPEGVIALMQVPSIGPKKAMILAGKLRINSLEDLKKAVEKHKIQGLKGFGEKSEEGIEKGIGIVRKSIERMPLGRALSLAEDLKQMLQQCRFIKRVELAGSIRRMKETIGDFDILATSDEAKLAMKYFVSLPSIKRVLAAGSTKSSVLLDNNIQVDLRIVDESCFGAAMQYFIGSKEHNIAVRKIAIAKGLKLSEYGLFKKNKPIAGKSEEELYAKLGMQWIPPEMRENKGEIELAIKRKLPQLVEQKDILSDLHMHTHYSDGNNSVAEMCHESINLGYKYIIISDHYLASVHSLDEKSIIKQHKEIDALNKYFEKEKKDFVILKGLEVEIKKDGMLNATPAVLKSLDSVTAAVHTSFQMPRPDFTKRLVTALENKHVNILAHPTCRSFGSREPSDFDMQKIIDTAKKHGKILEINAAIKRFDLNDENARLARESGVMLSIGTDAHAVEQLRLMKYGIAIARRAWCEKKDIINTYPWKKLQKELEIFK